MRTAIATVLITLGALLAPAAVIANWTQVELASTDAFVATFAPLASDPTVQAYVADQASTAIQGKLDVQSLTTDLFSGLSNVPQLGTKGQFALKSLQGAVVQGINGMIETTVTKFVQSPAFATVFTGALKVTHSQLTAALQGDRSGAIAISKGEVGLNLAPIIAQVKTLLVNQGLTFAAAIPEVDKTIPIIKSDQLAIAQTAYALTLAIGTWFPVFVLVLVLGGVLVAVRRRTALIVAASAIAFMMILTLLGIKFGKIVIVSSQLTVSVLPPDVARILLDQITAFARNSMISVASVAIGVIIAVWLFGPYTSSSRLRAAGSALARSIRDAGDKNGLSTGKFGTFVYRYRSVLRVLLALIAAAVIIFTRPLTLGVIVWTVVLALVVIAILEVVQRPSAVAATVTGP